MFSKRFSPLTGVPILLVGYDVKREDYYAQYSTARASTNRVIRYINYNGVSGQQVPLNLVAPLPVIFLHDTV